MKTIMGVFPNANVSAQGSNSYPIEVSVELNGKRFWGPISQKKLFRKYSSARAESVKLLTKALRKLKK